MPGCIAGESRDGEVRASCRLRSIGSIHSYQPCLPSTPADGQAAERCDVYWNNAFPDSQYLGAYPALVQAEIEPYMQADDLARIGRPLDWFGLNHYSPVYVKAAANDVLGFGLGDIATDIPLTPIGWPIMPDSFRDTLVHVSKRYGLPIYVLENGIGTYDKNECGWLSNRYGARFAGS